MFRKALLATTALLCIASLSSAAAPPDAPAGSRMQNIVPDRDANSEFLCDYGGLLVSESIMGYSGSDYSYVWTHVAVPLMGHGQTVKQIITRQVSSAYAVSVSAGIYSNSRSGFPGHLIAGGHGSTHGACETLTISIPPTTLAQKSTYWVEEMVPLPRYSEPNSTHWAIDRRSKFRAYTQYHTGYHSSGGWSSIGYTSPWTKVGGGRPYLRLR